MEFRQQTENHEIQGYDRQQQPAERKLEGPLRRDGRLGPLVNPASGRCLDAPNPVGNGARIYIHDCHGGANQQWTLDTAGIGLVRSAFAGKCLDNDLGRLANGNKIQIYDCNGGSNAQIWTVLGDGLVQFGGWCLDVANKATAIRSPVLLSLCNGGTNQEWRIGPNFSLINPVSGRCLDVPGSVTTNGTALWIFDCNGGVAQRWIPS